MSDLTSEKSGLNITWKIENIQCMANNTFLSSPTFKIGPSRHTKWTIIIYKTSENYCHIHLNRENTDDSLIITIESTVTVLDSSGMNTLLNNNCKTHSYHLREGNHLYFFQLKELKDFLFDNITVIHINLRDFSNFDSTVHRCLFQSSVEVEHRKGKFIIPHFSAINHNNYMSDRNDQHFLLLSNCEDATPFKITILIIKSEKIEIKIERANKILDTSLTLFCKLCFENDKLEQIWSAYHSYEFLPNKECVWNFPSTFEFSTLNCYSPKKVNNLYFKYELLICEQKQRTWLRKYEVEPCLSNHSNIKTTDKEKANLRDDLMCLYVEQKCPDVEIKADGRKFPAHKSILSARSPVFNAMFENNMLEKKINVVEISDIDAETVDRMLFFMYSEILSNQDWFSVVNLYKASDKYQILTLKDKCSEIIQDQLTTLNACDALLLADKYHDKELLSSIQDYIVTHEKSIVNSDKWKTIMDSQPKLACQIMHRICVKSN